MDLSGIGAWAGDKGPYLMIIGFLCTLVRILVSRLLAQQEIMIRAVMMTQRTTEVAERSAEVVAQVVSKE